MVSANALAHPSRRAPRSASNRLLQPCADTPYGARRAHRGIGHLRSCVRVGDKGRIDCPTTTAGTLRFELVSARRSLVM